jgi:hypothetical protein
MIAFLLGLLRPRRRVVVRIDEQQLREIISQTAHLAVAEALARAGRRVL